MTTNVLPVPLLETSLPRSWFGTRRFQIAALCLIGTALAVEGVLAVFVRTNDVANHYRQGQLLLHADPGAPAQTFRYVPYPAGRATLNAALAWLPYRAFRATLYLIAIAGLAGAFVLWERMASHHRPVMREAPRAAAVASLILLGPWVARDLDDCGLQILLLFLLSSFVFQLMRGRQRRAGWWLGVAIAYKATPYLCVPFALIRGGGRATWTATLVAASLCLSPVLFIGWERMVALNDGFFEVAASVAQSDEPESNGFEPPRHKNQSLMLALARGLRTYPPGHPLYLTHPLFVQFLDLSPHLARTIATAIIGLGLSLLAFRIARKRWRDGPRADLVPEWAVVCFLCAILSPICWGPHLVLGIPAAYLVLRDLFDRLARGVRPPSWMFLGLTAVAVLNLGFPRELIGAETSVLVLSYKPYALSAMILMGMVLLLPRDAARSISQSPGRH